VPAVPPGGVPRPGSDGGCGGGGTPATYRSDAEDGGGGRGTARVRGCARGGGEG